ncbi:unnamed protein product [Calicophoron daubneyi]|uniref:Uncharacterized protein n=1 Tax=Calicophoron daubneyi TaxID=300641 RepID=A0AAV2TVD3_CALDB
MKTSKIARRRPGQLGFHPDTPLEEVLAVQCTKHSAPSQVQSENTQTPSNAGAFTVDGNLIDLENCHHLCLPESVISRLRPIWNVFDNPPPPLTHHAVETESKFTFAKVRERLREAKERMNVDLDELFSNLGLDTSSVNEKVGQDTGIKEKEDVKTNKDGVQKQDGISKLKTPDFQCTTGLTEKRMRVLSNHLGNFPDPVPSTSKTAQQREKITSEGKRAKSNFREQRKVCFIQDSSKRKPSSTNLDLFDLQLQESNNIHEKSREKEVPPRGFCDEKLGGVSNLENIKTSGRHAVTTGFHDRMYSKQVQYESILKLTPSIKVQSHCLNELTSMWRNDRRPCATFGNNEVHAHQSRQNLSLQEDTSFEKTLRTMRPINLEKSLWDSPDEDSIKNRSIFQSLSRSAYESVDFFPVREHSNKELNQPFLCKEQRLPHLDLPIHPMWDTPDDLKTSTSFAMYHL